MHKNYLITSLTSCENQKLIKARVSNPDLALLSIPLCVRELCVSLIRKQTASCGTYARTQTWWGRNLSFRYDVVNSNVHGLFHPLWNPFELFEIESSPFVHHDLAEKTLRIRCTCLYFLFCRSSTVAWKDLAKLVRSVPFRPSWVP